jgi:hypothetical protein
LAKHLEIMLDNIIKKVDKINLKKLVGYQKTRYFQVKEKIEYLICLQFFLSLRQKIKKEVAENYQNKTAKEIAKSIVVYDAYRSVEYKNNYIFDTQLQPLINDYVNKQIFEVEKHNLKLNL